MEGKTKTRLRKAIGYIRVSREGGRSQKNGGESYRTKAMQEARIKELARANGLQIVAWYVDENESGKDTKRPQFQEALAAMRAGEAEVMVVAKLSRFARSVQDTETTVRELDSIQAGLICGDLPEMTGPWGKAFRQIMAIFAELELELARESWLDAVSDAVASGVFPGKAPRGYRKTKARGLEPDPEVAPLVRDLYLGRGAGSSWAVLLKEWHEAGGPAISRQGLATILGSTTYKGQAKVNGHHIEVEPLVSVEEWEAAQAEVVTAPRPARREGSLLGGLMTCSSCGGTMSNRSMGSGKGMGYRCQAARAGHAANCPQRMSVTRELADKVVEQALLEWAGDLAAEGIPNGESLAGAQLKLEAAQAELAAFTIHTPAATPGYKEGLDRRQAELDEAQAEVDSLKASKKVEAVRVTLAGIWPELELEDKRKLLAQAVESIVVVPGSGQRLGGHATEEARLAAVRDRLIITFRSDAL